MTDLPDYYTQAALAISEVTSFSGGLDANKPDNPVSRDIYYATDTKILYICVVDGTFININALYLLLAGGTMTGAIAMGTNAITGLADPTNPQDAATRAYVLAQAALRLALTGGTMSGNIAMGNNKVTGLAAPTNANDAVRKAYADALEPYTDAEAVAAVEAAGLILAAAKKIVLANDGLIQIGTEAGSLEFKQFSVALPFGAILQPKDGNKSAVLMLMPKGTEDAVSYNLRNSEDLDNYGVVNFTLDGATLSLDRDVQGAGVLPTIWRIALDTAPFADKLYDLGTSTYKWLESWVMHRQLIQALAVDHTWSGLTSPMFAGAALTIGQACYVGGDSKMELADADAAASMPIIALATGTINEDFQGEFLMQGFFRDDTWDWTPGGLLYASVTPGALSQTAPVGSGDQVQVVGVAKTADIIYFNPSFELVEIS